MRRVTIDIAPTLVPRGGHRFDAMTGTVTTQVCSLALTRLLLLTAHDTPSIVRAYLLSCVNVLPATAQYYSISRLLRRSPLLLTAAFTGAWECPRDVYATNGETDLSRLPGATRVRRTATGGTAAAQPRPMYKPLGPRLPTSASNFPNTRGPGSQGHNVQVGTLTTLSPKQQDLHNVPGSLITLVSHSLDNLLIASKLASEISH